MRRGFTLIELVLVTVLIGILSALAVSRVSVARQRAYSSAMQSDLRNLATAQEAYFSDNSCSVSVDGDQRSAPTCTTSGESGK